jgi:hypothetical protein
MSAMNQAPDNQALISDAFCTSGAAQTRERNLGDLHKVLERTGHCHCGWSIYTRG